MVKRYEIRRFFADGRPPQPVRRRLPLEEAQAHCCSEETHEVDEDGRVAWFDGYEEES